jgi:hypothetical protein
MGVQFHSFFQPDLDKPVEEEPRTQINAVGGQMNTNRPTAQTLMASLTTWISIEFEEIARGIDLRMFFCRHFLRNWVRRGGDCVIQVTLSFRSVTQGTDVTSVTDRSRWPPY